MVRYSGRPDKLLGLLVDHGYSENVAEAIWRWYKPSLKVLETR